MGEEAFIERIVPDYLLRLYRHLNGHSEHINAASAVRVNDNYIVDSVIVAKNYSIRFHSNETFDADFKAKLETADVNAGGSIDIKAATDRVIEVSVKDDKYYVIAFTVRDWDHL